MSSFLRVPLPVAVQLLAGALSVWVRFSPHVQTVRPLALYCVILGLLQVCFGCHRVLSWALVASVSTLFSSLLLLWIPTTWVRLSPHMLGLLVVHSVTALLVCS